MGQKFNKEPINNTCPICLLEVTRKDFNIGCNHYMHKNCAILSISETIRENKIINCPICRKEIKRKYLTEIIYSSKEIPLQLFDLLIPKNWIENHVIEYIDIKSFYIYYKKCKYDYYSIYYPLIKKNKLIIPFYVNSLRNILFDLKNINFNKYGLKYNYYIEVNSNIDSYIYLLISYFNNSYISLQLFNKMDDKVKFYIKDINKCLNINVDEGTISNGLNLEKISSLHLQFRSFIIIDNYEAHLIHEVSNFFTY